MIILTPAILREIERWKVSSEKAGLLLEKCSLYHRLSTFLELPCLGLSFPSRVSMRASPPGLDSSDGYSPFQTGQHWIRPESRCPFPFPAPVCSPVLSQVSSEWSVLENQTSATLCSLLRLHERTQLGSHAYMCLRDSCCSGRAFHRRSQNKLFDSQCLWLPRKAGELEGGDCSFGVKSSLESEAALIYESWIWSFQRKPSAVGGPQRVLNNWQLL